jgi:hypothetical protein
MTMITNNEFIFSVKQIFTTVLEGKDGYYIAPYQRGYKWGKYVRVMFQDILNACNKDSDKDYYLNFISIKSTEIEGKSYLELIDGQQRITTLVLFWSLVNKQKDDLSITLSNTYTGIDIDLIDKLIVCRQRSESLSLLLDLNNHLDNTQDNYYLRTAVIEINSFLQELKSSNYNFQKYLDYFSNHVKIIINEEKTGISAAEIFGNLNSNKVDLTDTYLVKGLLLSLASRDTDGQETKRYREIMESRTVMGRLWDEIYYWTDSKPVKLYFWGSKFPIDKSTHPLDVLIELTAEDLDIEILKEEDDPFPIFNSLYKIVNKYSSATQFLDRLKAKYWFFKRMYESKNNTIHNLLGLILYSIGDNQTNRVKLLKELSCKKDDTIILTYLKKEQLNNLQNIVVKDLQYNINNFEIYKVLLSISAIDDQLGSFSKFNFFNFINTENGWSIEHIFPQNITISKQSKKYIDNWLTSISKTEGINQDEINEFKEKAKKIYEFEGNKDMKSEINQLNQEATVLFDRIVDSLDIETDSIGNLALLGLIDNIKLSNALFEEKKYKLLSYSSKGSFVPKHTFSAFNKTIINDASLIFQQNNLWTNKEIIEHRNWLSDKIDSIKKELTPISND